METTQNQTKKYSVRIDLFIDIESDGDCLYTIYETALNTLMAELDIPASRVDMPLDYCVAWDIASVVKPVN
jgi:hypothetical protein